MKKGIIIIIALVLLLTLAYWQRGWLRDTWESWTAPELPEAVNRNAVINSNTSLNANSTVNENTNRNLGNTNTTVVLPDEINLAVPFTSQAPHANWDLPFKEACEEASALMVHRYLIDNPIRSKDDATEAILDIVAFQENNYGFYLDTDVAETARFIEDMWGHSATVYSGAEVTAERIRQELANGNPVMIPAAGRQLGNPNFTPPGPIYHMLVVKGYTDDGRFITNDPGTRNGADYVYSESVLMNAIHDWNDGDVENGQKAMLVVQGE